MKINKALLSFEIEPCGKNVGRIPNIQYWNIVNLKNAPSWIDKLSLVEASGGAFGLDFGSISGPENDLKASQVQ